MTDETAVEPTVDDSSSIRKRNPLERAVVWGGIAILLVIVLIEARAQFGYARSLAAIQTAMSDTEAYVTLDDLRGMMAFAPAEREGDGTGLVGNRVFSWYSLFKSGQFEITVDVSTDEEPLILNFATAGAPEEPVPGTETIDPDSGS